MKYHANCPKLIAMTALGFSLCSSPVFATVFNGNGNSGFGGAIGGGSLNLSDNGSTVSGSLTRGGGQFNDALVIYIDSVSGGFANTSGFSDRADGLRRAISGFNNAGQRSTMNFDANFRPDFVIALGPSSDSFGGLWSLAAGGNNSLGFLNSVNLTPLNNTATNYSFSFDLATIGLTPGNGQSFKLFATYTSNTAFRSNEALAGNVTGNQGFNPFTQNGFGTYATQKVPESSGVLGFCIVFGIGATVSRRNFR